jgi:hypothetical protein
MAGACATRALGVARWPLSAVVVRPIDAIRATPGSASRRRIVVGMPGDLHYAHEKYSAARDTLAEGAGSPRERLADAYLSQGSRASPLRRGLGPEISDELSTRIETFDERMTSVAPEGDEGSIVATINSMTVDDVQEAMRELVAIASALDWEYHDSRHRPS